MANFLTENGIEGYLGFHDTFIADGRCCRVEIVVEDATASFACRGGGTRSWTEVDLSEPGSLERLLTLCRDHLCPDS